MCTYADTPNVECQCLKILLKKHSRTGAEYSKRPYRFDWKESFYGKDVRRHFTLRSNMIAGLM